MLRLRAKSLLRIVLSASFLALTNPTQDALAQTDRDLISVGMEFCMLATQDPPSAVNFATARGFVASTIGANTTSYARRDEGPFLSVRVIHQESGDLAVDCGFKVDAVGQVSREEVRHLASRFGLQHNDAGGTTHFLARTTPHLVTIVYARSTEGIPCPGDGRLEIAPELLQEHPEVMDSVLQVCDRLGFEVLVHSTYTHGEVRE